MSWNCGPKQILVGTTDEIVSPSQRELSSDCLLIVTISVRDFQKATMLHVRVNFYIERMYITYMRKLYMYWVKYIIKIKLTFFTFNF